MTFSRCSSLCGFNLGDISNDTHSRSIASPVFDFTICAMITSTCSNGVMCIVPLSNLDPSVLPLLLFRILFEPSFGVLTFMPTFAEFLLSAVQIVSWASFPSTRLACSWYCLCWSCQMLARYFLRCLKLLIGRLSVSSTMPQMQCVRLD